MSDRAHKLYEEIVPYMDVLPAVRVSVCMSELGVK